MRGGQAGTACGAQVGAASTHLACPSSQSGAVPHLPTHPRPPPASTAQPAPQVLSQNPGHLAAPGHPAARIVAHSQKRSQVPVHTFQLLGRAAALVQNSTLRMRELMYRVHCGRGSPCSNSSSEQRWQQGFEKFEK